MPVRVYRGFIDSFPMAFERPEQYQSRVKSCLIYIVRPRLQQLPVTRAKADLDANRTVFAIDTVQGAGDMRPGHVNVV